MHQKKDGPSFLISAVDELVNIKNRNMQNIPEKHANTEPVERKGRPRPNKQWNG